MLTTQSNAERMGADTHGMPPQSSRGMIDDDHNVRRNVLKGQTSPQVVAPTPIRPIALKVHKPIPQHATEEFYQATFAAGVAGEAVHVAVMESHDWHRKWTQQDEQGHTMPEPEEQPLQAIPDYYAYDFLDRGAGAKNPSPDDVSVDMEHHRKRTRNVDDDEPQHHQEQPRSEQPEPGNQTLVSPMTPTSDDSLEGGDNTDVQPDVKRPFLASPQLVRPVALRVSRPVEVHPPQDPHQIEAIPRDIIKTAVFPFAGSPLSPITLPSMSSACGRRYQDPGPHVIDDTEQDNAFVPVLEIVHPNHLLGSSQINLVLQNARDGILEELAISGGETNSDRFAKCLSVLSEHFLDREIDTCVADCHDTEGMWLTLTKPSFFANLGETDAGDPLYTLGRMAFDMFAPTSLVCSLQGTFNSVKQLTADERLTLDSVPKALHEDVRSGHSILRTYE